MRNAFEILRPPGRPNCRWEDNVTIDLGEIVGEGVDWIHLARDGDQWRDLVNAVMNLRFS
jgi:hypothetical protein